MKDPIDLLARLRRHVAAQRAGELVASQVAMRDRDEAERQLRRAAEREEATHRAACSAATSEPLAAGDWLAAERWVARVREEAARQHAEVERARRESEQAALDVERRRQAYREAEARATHAERVASERARQLRLRQERAADEAILEQCAGHPRREAR